MYCGPDEYGFEIAGNEAKTEFGSYRQRLRCPNFNQRPPDLTYITVVAPEVRYIPVT